MKSELATLSRIYGVRRFPPGRLFTVLLAMRMMAGRHGMHGLIDRVDLALEAARIYVNKRRLRQGRRQGRGGGLAKKIDRVIDDDIADIAHIAGREAERFPDARSGKVAQALLDAFFTNGVGPITQIPYDEELVVVENMMALLRAEHAEAIDTLGIERLVARIEDNLPLYREALAPDEGVGPAELAEAYEAMQIGLLKVLGFVTVSVDDLAQREALLAPLFEHDAQLSTVYAARRRGGEAGAEDVVPADDLDLDAEVRAALDEAAREAAEAEAAAAAAADGGDAGGDAGADPAPDAGADAAPDADASAGDVPSGTPPIRPLNRG